MHQKKKILVTATTFPRYEGDTQPSFVKSLSEELLKNGLDVHVLVPHSYGLRYNEEVNGLKIHRFIYFFPKKLQKLAYGGIVPNITKNKFLALQLPFLFIFELVKLNKLLKKYNIGVVHSHWLFPQGLSGAIAKKIFNIYHILTIHGGDLFILLKIPLGKSLIKFIIKNTDHITCASKELKDNLISVVGKKYDNKTSIISMGVYTKDYKDKFKFNNNILFLGRLANKKGVKYLLESTNFIKNKNIKILIAGDGPLKSSLENFVKTNKIQDRVKFLGFVHGKEKINLIKSCGIFIIPSIITKYGDRESVPVSLLEAMAASKTIIATKVGGIGELIKHNYNGLLIKEKNSYEIANAINRIINNKKLAKKLAMNARKSVLNYDWKIIGEKYYKILMEK